MIKYGLFLMLLSGGEHSWYSHMERLETYDGIFGCSEADKLLEETAGFKDSGTAVEFYKNYKGEMKSYKIGQRVTYACIPIIASNG